MKLPKAIACLSAIAKGNFNRLTITVEVLDDEFSDRGSIPLISTKNGSVKLLFFRNEFALIYRLRNA